jgi:hypothetical protein
MFRMLGRQAYEKEFLSQKRMHCSCDMQERQ